MDISQKYVHFLKLTSTMFIKLQKTEHKIPQKFELTILME